MTGIHKLPCHSPASWACGRSGCLKGDDLETDQIATRCIGTNRPSLMTRSRCCILIGRGSLWSSPSLGLWYVPRQARDLQSANCGLPGDLPRTAVPGMGA